MGFTVVGKPAAQVMTAIKEAVARVSGDGAIIMTDMFGGTPSNMSISFLEEGRVEVLTGVNLPMLMKLPQIRQKVDLQEVAQALKQSGQTGITSTWPLNIPGSGKQTEYKLNVPSWN